MALSVTAGLLGLYTSRGVRFSSRSVAVALVAVFLIGVFHLVPLPPRAVVAVSPAATAANYDRLYAEATMQPDIPAAASALTARRPRSIKPARTVLGLVFLAAFAILFVGCVHGISVVGPGGIARGILVLGVLVALLYVMQPSLPR